MSCDIIMTKRKTLTLVIAVTLVNQGIYDKKNYYVLIHETNVDLNFQGNINWENDQHFAQQRLNQCNSSLIRRVDNIDQIANK